MGGGIEPRGTGDNGICGAVKLDCFFIAEGRGAGASGVGCATIGETAFVLFWVGSVMAGFGGACGGGGAGIVGGGGGAASTYGGRF